MGRRYRPMYEIEISHPGLNTYRHIRGSDKWVVEQKAEAQLAKWDEQWAKKQAADKKRREREKAAAHKEARKDKAIEQTRNAQGELDCAMGLLNATLDVDDAIDWSSLLRDASFSEARPSKPKSESEPQPPTAEDYAPKLGLLGLILPPVKRKRIEAADASLKEATVRWQAKLSAHKAAAIAAKEKYETSHSAWAARKEAYEAEQAAHNASIQELEKLHKSGDPDAVEEHADLVLTQSDYPLWYNRDWELGFEAETGTLVVNYRLPIPSDVPTLKEVKYVASRDAFDEKFISQAEQKRNYDDIVYQICLRTLHELFEADRDTNHLKSIAFNGITEFLSPETGKMTTNCICSLQVTPEDFLEINLDAVEPKACFKGLKGVSAASLSQLAPVAPLMILDRDDSRFIDAQDVASKIAEGDNIAAMDWQDFEHLIRQLFEAEYSSEGCEVRVTQGSRDGGVDAIAFDPDPIRGGKVVIQAKRYTNTVDVASVRDLYGTVVNEGATKGILVTTSQFGPDARKFAAGKPLALIDGPNLLHMLGRHGTKARIDLSEAKSLLA